MHEMLLEYTPQIQRFSVDESFLDLSSMEHLYPNYMKLAEKIQERIKKELGFTVNANYDLSILKRKFNSQGTLLWNYANGIDNSEVRKSNHIEMKGIGNSTTIAFHIEDRETAHKVLLALCETVGMRLRDSNWLKSCAGWCW